jgi:hypothetical protein
MPGGAVPCRVARLRAWLSPQGSWALVKGWGVVTLGKEPLLVTLGLLYCGKANGAGGIAEALLLDVPALIGAGGE